MARIQYVAKLAVDRDTGLPVSALEGQEVVIVRRGTTTPAAISEDEAGTLLVPGSVRTVSSNLFIPSFWVDTTEGPVSALGGGVEVPLESVEGVARRLDTLEPQFGASVAAAEGAQAAAEATTTEVATLRKWIELGVTQRNLVTNPKPFDATGWNPGPAVTRAVVMESGTPCLEVTVITPNIPGQTYVYVGQQSITPSPGIGRWAAVGLDVKPLTAEAAASMRVIIRAQNGTATTEQTTVSTVPGGWSAGTWSRLVGSVQQVSEADNVDVLLLPSGNQPLGAMARARRAVVAFADTKAGAEAAVATYFDGDTPPSANRAARWSGTPNASVSELIDMSAISSDLVAAAEAAADAAEAAANTNLPSGGNTGQVLAKRSGQDRDVEWITPSGGSSGGATTWDQISGKPATYPASAHTHTLSQLTDMSGLGRQVSAAGDAQTFRSLIGAGTGNGTSNLTLGTTASTAAAGNHTHTASSITFTPPSGMTATNVQDAIVQAAQTGGGSGGGTNTVYIWKQSGGAYPALPSTKPAGVEEVAARGAQSPIQLGAVIPSWIGAGAGKASLEYLYNPTLT